MFSTATAAQSLLLKPKPAGDREVRNEKATENGGSGTHDRHAKSMANVVPILEAKEGGEGALKTEDQE